ncbi:hypothetical protein [Streptomyces virginiae]|uniref:hypothetical protein n=1 Tax=Streptomyces virginiae TaxID=1961 RepID=UPI00332F0425
MERESRVGVGNDASDGHYTVAVETDGETLVSMKAIRDEGQLITPTETARGRAEKVRWSVGVSSQASAMVSSRMARGVVYARGNTVSGTSGVSREEKTDANMPEFSDSQSQGPRPLDTPVGPSARYGLLNRLRDPLVGICPVLQRAVGCTAAKKPVGMLTRTRSRAPVPERSETADNSAGPVSEKRHAKTACGPTRQLLALTHDLWTTSHTVEMPRSANPVGLIRGARIGAIVGDPHGCKGARDTWPLEVVLGRFLRII